MRSSTRFTLVLAVMLVSASTASAQESPGIDSPAVRSEGGSDSSAALIAPASRAAVPTLDAARAGVRQNLDARTSPAPAARSGGMGQPVALMVVGGAAVLTGLIIQGGAG